MGGRPLYLDSALISLRGGWKNVHAPPIFTFHKGGEKRMLCLNIYIALAVCTYVMSELSFIQNTAIQRNISLSITFSQFSLF
ncbi:hypothetical protein TSAR_002006 [Trichomalopsis sarcophagae]|uniref:Uncharacterized protein n=1 Tax=Trichomalopsis sarcophagae TaxID=543379 RepID=A0A232EIW0_9HYME|nr:hypothetical protein TSAR_002006 [Trichomalopsis sarcophagae]